MEVPGVRQHFACFMVIGQCRGFQVTSGDRWKLCRIGATAHSMASARIAKSSGGEANGHGETGGGAVGNRGFHGRQGDGGRSAHQCRNQGESAQDGRAAGLRGQHGGAGDARRVEQADRPAAAGCDQRLLRHHCPGAVGVLRRGGLPADPVDSQRRPRSRIPPYQGTGRRAGRGGHHRTHRRAAPRQHQPAAFAAARAAAAQRAGTQPDLLRHRRRSGAARGDRASARARPPAHRLHRRPGHPLHRCLAPSRLPSRLRRHGHRPGAGHRNARRTDPDVRRAGDE
ncbi:hypothetical protein D3C81_1009900 [compost metagenome]